MSGDIVLKGFCSATRFPCPCLRYTLEHPCTWHCYHQLHQEVHCHLPLSWFIHFNCSFCVSRYINNCREYVILRLTFEELGFQPPFAPSLSWLVGVRVLPADREDTTYSTFHSVGGCTSKKHLCVLPLYARTMFSSAIMRPLLGNVRLAGSSRMSWN